MFAHSHGLIVNQFYLTHKLELFSCYHFGPVWTWEQWQWRDTLHSPKIQDYWSLTIRLFDVISKKLVDWDSYLSAETHSMYSTAPADSVDHRWNSNRFYHPGQSTPDCNDNKEASHSTQSSRSGASELDSVWCLTNNTRGPWRMGLIHLQTIN